MRPLWNGSISFGLVSIPVRMFSASESREGIEFHMLHKKDHSPIRFARICKEDGEEIEWDDIVKGYEYAEGQYIILTPEELDELEPERSSTIDIQQFVKEAEIDIRYFEKPYYLEPVKGGEKAYALLRSSLDKAGVLAVAKYATHEREHLAVIKPVGRALVLTQMRFPTDLRSGSGLTFPTEKEVSERELDMALKLIKQGTKPFIAEDYRDTYTEELEEMIKAKVKGKTPAKRKTPARSDTSAKDLMSILKASLSADTADAAAKTRKK
jgi:DNA end-binding protein Ku